MSSTHLVQPEEHGASAPAHASQVAVRDGNRLLCPCCGEVLFVLKEPPPVGPSRRGSDTRYPLHDPRSRGVPTEEPRPPSPRRLEELPQPQTSYWDAVADAQDELKAAAWQAFAGGEAAGERERLEQALDADDPAALADLLMLIDPQVAAYACPAEDPPAWPKQPKPGRPPRRKRRPGTRQNVEKLRRDRARKRRWHDWLFEAAATHDVKRLRAWTFYRLKLQDLKLRQQIRWQQARVDRVRRERLGRRRLPPLVERLPVAALPKSLLSVKVVEFDLRAWIQRVRADQRHAARGTGSELYSRLDCLSDSPHTPKKTWVVAPGVDRNRKRGPP